LREMLAEARPQRPARAEAPAQNQERSRLNAAHRITRVYSADRPSPPRPHPQSEFRHERPRHDDRAGAVSVRISGHTQKPPRCPSTARRCVAFAWRFAASSGVERSRACLAMGRTALIRRWCVAQCRANDPR